MPVGQVAERAHHPGAELSAEVADRVDERDASGRGGAAQERGRDGPERRLDRALPDLADREAQHQQRGTPLEERREHQAQCGHERAGRDVALALPGLVRVASDQHHADEREGEGNHHQPEVAAPERFLEHAGQPEEDAVGDGRVEEVEQAEQQQLAIEQAPPRAAVRHALLPLGRHLLAEPGPTLGIEPARLLGLVRQHQQRQHAEQHRRKALDQEDPLPAGEPQAAVEPQQRLGQRRPHQHRDRRRHHEQRAVAGALAGGDPVGQVEHDPGEEAGLGDAEQEAEQVEAALPRHEDGRHRDEAPDDHDPRDPAPRAHALEDQVARDLEQEVAEEEQPRPEAVGLVAEPQVALQHAADEADVDAVDVRDHVADEGERDEPPRHARQHAGFDLVGSRAHSSRAASIPGNEPRRAPIVSAAFASCQRGGIVENCERAAAPPRGPAGPRAKRVLPAGGWDRCRSGGRIIVGPPAR